MSDEATRDETVVDERDDGPQGEPGTDAEREPERSDGSEPAPPTEPVRSTERTAHGGRRFVPGLAVVLAVLGALWLGTKIAPDAAPPPEPVESARAQTWTCSMHPQIRMAEPGQCPICGMDLVEATGEGAVDEAPDRVTLSDRAQAMAAVRTELVRRTEPRTDVRLLGQVDYDETRLRMITPWTAGRVDRLKVRVTGEKIRRGQLIATLYSPEVYAAMRDLIVAAKQAERLAGGLPGSATLASQTVEATRERLRLLGVSESLIEQIERDRQAPKQVQVRSPYAGTVLERKVEEGDYVEAGTVMFHIADLSTVWVQIDAYESDLPLLSLGQTVELSVESLPQEAFEGEVAFIDPVIDPQTRTARVRVEVDNADGQLRPGMFAQARIQGRAGDRDRTLVIPATAPLFTGRRSVVYVQEPGSTGRYALREVRLGPRAGPLYPVLAGLAEGERVVSEGAFLVDADLQLRGGGSMMTRDDDEADRAAMLVVTPQMLAALQPVVEHYLESSRTLAADEIDVARGHLGMLAEATTQVEATGPKQTRQAWSELASSLSGHARHAATATDTAEVRVAFEALSDGIEVVLERFGNPTAGPLDVAFCPMAFDNKGAQWVQRDEPLANPYYGAAMLRCGEVRATLAPGERLGAGPESAPGSEPRPGAGHRPGHDHG